AAPVRSSTATARRTSGGSPARVRVATSSWARECCSSCCRRSADTEMGSGGFCWPTGRRQTTPDPFYDRPRPQLGSFMKKLLLSLTTIALVLAASTTGSAWGVRAHTWINRVAVRTIPDDGPVFLKAHEDWIAYLSTIPDTWRRP